MSNKSRLQTNNTNLQALIDKANALPEAGGDSSGGRVEYEIITIPAGATSATYTLPRVTNAYGAWSVGSLDEITSSSEYNYITYFHDTLYGFINYMSVFNGSATIEFETAQVYYNQGTITWDGMDAHIYDNGFNLILINDSTKAVLHTCTPSGTSGSGGSDI